jgi:hypothetical protein
VSQLLTNLSLSVTVLLQEPSDVLKKPAKALATGVSAEHLVNLAVEKIKKIASQDADALFYLNLLLKYFLGIAFLCSIL